MGRGQVTKKQIKKLIWDFFVVVWLGFVGFVWLFILFLFSFLIHVNSLIQNSANRMEGVAWGQTPAALWSSRTALERW